MLFSEAKAIEKKKYWQDREPVGNGDNGRELWKQRTMCKVIGTVKEIAWSHDGIPEMKLFMMVLRHSSRHVGPLSPADLPA